MLVKCGLCVLFQYLFVLCTYVMFQYLSWQRKIDSLYIIINKTRYEQHFSARVTYKQILKLIDNDNNDFGDASEFVSVTSTISQTLVSHPRSWSAFIVNCFSNRLLCYHDAILPTMQQFALSQREQAVESSGILLQAKRLPLHRDKFTQHLRLCK